MTSFFEFLQSAVVKALVDTVGKCEGEGEDEEAAKAAQADQRKLIDQANKLGASLDVRYCMCAWTSCQTEGFHAWKFHA